MNGQVSIKNHLILVWSHPLVTFKYTAHWLHCLCSLPAHPSALPCSPCSPLPLSAHLCSPPAHSSALPCSPCSPLLFPAFLCSSLLTPVLPCSKCTAHPCSTLLTLALLPLTNRSYKVFVGLYHTLIKVMCSSLCNVQLLKSAENSLTPSFENEL